MPKDERERSHIAKKLDYRSRQLNLKQIEVHEQMKTFVDVSRATINNWYQGIFEPTLTPAFYLAKILKIRLDALADPAQSVETLQQEGSDPKRAALEYYLQRVGIDPILEAAVKLYTSSQSPERKSWCGISVQSSGTRIEWEGFIFLSRFQLKCFLFTEF